MFHVFPNAFKFSWRCPPTFPLTRTNRSIRGLPSTTNVALTHTLTGTLLAKWSIQQFTKASGRIALDCRRLPAASPPKIAKEQIGEVLRIQAQGQENLAATSWRYVRALMRWPLWSISIRCKGETLSPPNQSTSNWQEHQKGPWAYPKTWELQKWYPPAPC